MKYILLLFLSLTTLVFSQETIRLDSCIQWAKKRYPLLKQNQFLEANSKINQKAINENWFPQLSFLAKANYQSEVVTFPGMNLNFPHDTYLSSLSINQSLFDSGQTAQQRKTEKLNASVQIQQNEIEIYRIIEQVNQIYVSILLSRENLEILELYKNNLDNRLANISAALRNGLSTQSNLDELEAEILKTEQSILEAKDNLQAFYLNFEMYTGKKVSASTTFDTTPVGGITQTSSIARPELKLFSLQENLLDSKYKLTTTQAMPKLVLYADANYGRPGPNFINQNLRYFANAGVMMKWNVTSLYGLSREKNRLNVQQQLINIQREQFLFNLNNTLTAQNAQINSIKEVIEKDKQIVDKRHVVTLAAASKLENGKITMTNYLTQLNAELQAKLNQKIHEIRLMNAMTTYNTTKGITNF